MIKQILNGIAALTAPLDTREELTPQMAQELSRCTMPGLVFEKDLTDEERLKLLGFCYSLNAPLARHELSDGNIIYCDTTIMRDYRVNSPIQPALNGFSSVFAPDYYHLSEILPRLIEGMPVKPAAPAHPRLVRT